LQHLTIASFATRPLLLRIGSREGQHCGHEPLGANLGRQSPDGFLWRYDGYCKACEEDLLVQFDGT
jgi:hypothetical protein